MTEKSLDVKRAIKACKIITDGRDLTDLGSIMVTLEHTVATMLIALMDINHEKAVGMLNEGLVPGVESRIALHASRRTET